MNGLVLVLPRIHAGSEILDTCCMSPLEACGASDIVGQPAYRAKFQANERPYLKQKVEGT